MPSGYVISKYSGNDAEVGLILCRTSDEGFKMAKLSSRVFAPSFSTCVRLSIAKPIDVHHMPPVKRKKKPAL